jgi:hypothetical protein
MKVGITGETVAYPQSESELAALFRSLGARAPEQWVSYVLADPEPQLARYLFRKQAWERVIGDGQIAWIDEEIDRASCSPSEPYAGLGLALQRVLDAGASREDISEIGRCLQAQALSGISYLIDGPAYEEPKLENIQWRLFRVNQDETPRGEPIGGLHESVLETDPTGREMRPKT